MRIDQFKAVLSTHGVELKAHNWESLLKEIQGHPKLPSPAVGSAWNKLGPALQHLYVSVPGVASGLLKTSREDLLVSVRFIDSRYKQETITPPTPRTPKYVYQWKRIVTELDQARHTKKIGKRPTPHVDLFTGSITSSVGIEKMLEAVLEGDMDALEGLKELLLTEPEIKEIPGHIPPEEKLRDQGHVVVV